VPEDLWLCLQHRWRATIFSWAVVGRVLKLCHIQELQSSVLALILCRLCGHLTETTYSTILEEAFLTISAMLLTVVGEVAAKSKLTHRYDPVKLKIMDWVCTGDAPRSPCLTPRWLTS